MTPIERRSLRSAITITVSVYAALTAVLFAVHWGSVSPGTPDQAELTRPLRVRIGGVVGDGSRGGERGTAAMGRPYGKRSGPSGAVAAHALRRRPTSRAAATPKARLLKAEALEPGAPKASTPKTEPPTERVAAGANGPPSLSSGIAAGAASGGKGVASRAPTAASRVQRAAEGAGSGTAASGPPGEHDVSTNPVGPRAVTAVQPGRARRGASPVGGSGESGSSAVEAMLATIRRRVLVDRVYPPAAQRRGIQGRVTLEVEIGAGGRLKRLRIVQSSGYPILDSAGTKLLRSVFPVANTLSRAFSVLVPISYRLTG